MSSFEDVTGEMTRVNDEGFSNDFVDSDIGKS
jgi:hypothetical protein